MCGIAGFIGSENLSAAQAVSDTLVHRGPDAGSVIYDPQTSLHLIHRRLSVLDIDGGAQPMWNREETIGVVFNGEIYNHLDLRVELMAHGYVFQTDHSDTEILVHGYAHWGEGLALRLNGMFAFAILDKKKKTLYLARDRFGEKPLYIYQHADRFAFASEVQAFRAMPGLNLKVSALSQAKYFSFGFFPGGSSLFENTEQLKAGHHATLDLSGPQTPDWHASLKAYWQFELRPDTDKFQGLSDDDVAEAFWEKFQSAIERRLISDVPMGLFLSGGLDSSAILAAINSATPKPDLDCFTIGFAQESYDETQFARQAAEYFGSRHHVKNFDDEAVLGGVDTLLPHFHEPLGDPSILPTAMLAGFAREKVTVALTGDGGDELLAGYDPFLALKFARLCQRFAMPFTFDVARRLLRLMPKRDSYMAFDFKLARALEGIIEDRPLWEPVWMGPITPRNWPLAFDKDFAREEIFTDIYALYETFKSAATLEQALAYFTQFYLTNNILVKTDRATMHHSLESRAVFLDNDLVEFCAQLPSHYKLRGRERKFILKTALKGRLPANLINRKKQGFGIPMSQWLRESKIADRKNCVPFLKDDFVNRARTQHQNRSEDQRLFLYSWIAANQSLSGRFG